MEVHIFDFSDNIYNQLLTVTFKRKLRSEQTFASINDLKMQIEQDIGQARAWFAQS